jgi:UDP-GlcNAc:undecaprenyl-phosphate GlcNAc-1-phosphate transferase
MIYIASLLISMFSTIVLIPIFTTIAVKVKAMDIPNERKVHKIPIPKAGGISMALGLMFPIFIWCPMQTMVQAILIGAWVVIVFGLIDDFMDLDYKIKFLGQLVAALIVVLYGGIKISNLGTLLPSEYTLHDVFAIPLSLFVIIGVTNAINLADGLDGLAGGICLLSFLCLGFLGFQNEYFAVTLFCVTIMGAIAGFLRFNTYPAKVFMGDAGSQLLGFFIVTLALVLTQKSSSLSPVLPMILIGLPIIDTLGVMAERISKGGSPFDPDRRHLHHKLMELGLFHNESVVVIYALQAFLVTSAYFFRSQSEWYLILYYIGFSLFILALLAIAKKTQWKRQKYYFLDKIVKERLRVLKEKSIFIKITFKTILVGVPALYIITCLLLPGDLPGYFILLSLGLLVAVVFMKLTNNARTFNSVRIATFLSIPFLVYYSEISRVAWINETLFKFYNYAFLIVALFCCRYTAVVKTGGL